MTASNACAALRRGPRSRWLNLACALVVAAAALAARGGVQAAPEIAWGREGIPILLYHQVLDTPGPYAVTPWELENQLIWLRDNGYVSITPSELQAAWSWGAPLPERAVMLTIDDGWPSQSIFVDLVNRYGFRAAYFLPNFASVSEDEIRALDASGEVCGHTVTHPNLENLSYDEIFEEVHGNRVWLEGIVGHPVTCFAYPFGGYNDYVTQAVRDAGMQMAFLAWGGLTALDDSYNPMTIRRVNVNGAYPIDDLVSVLYGDVGY
ncbi:MAG: polysaccharide deacetylase family protein [Chloroflexota bacterium]